MHRFLKLVGGTLLVAGLTFPVWSANKSYMAQQVNPHSPVIDGRLDDAAWQKAQWGNHFTQKTPYEGKAPSQKTAFKIIYDQKNVYVGIQAYDTEPDKIVRRMSRRDNREGDWVEVVFDSYYDRRTGFSFSVNAAGVKNDAIISSDGENWDESWDPIWHVKTAPNTAGWTAEMKIPLSQLRFDRKENQTWGLHVARFLHRHQEIAEWNLIPRQASGWVSMFGSLTGIKKLNPKRQVALLPYSVGQYENYDKEEGNPFSKGHGGQLTGGLDGKIGITNNMILDFTINPDFGQVEADPSEVNLSAFESFFEEKRPFFIEGRNILNFQVTPGNNGFSRDNLFYSRRIGRSPQHWPDTDDYEEDAYVNGPTNTTILGAFKLTGKTRSGVSIGVLNSITAKETAVVDYLGDRHNETVEPLTNYFTLRLQKDYNQGKTTIGGMMTATNRNLKESHLNFLHRSAYTGGLDFFHSWKNKEWFVQLNTVFSHVRGDKEAILETQESSRRYFQRPDADHLTLDPNRTSLSGHGGTFSVGKTGGGRLRFVGFLTWRSPGLELNDVGYLRSADRIMQAVWTSYRITEPFAIFRNFSIEVNQWSGWDFGKTNLFKGGNINLNMQFKNYWSFGTGINREGSYVSPTSLRGGPALKEPGGWNHWVFLRSDGRKKFRVFGVWSNFYGDLNANRVKRYRGGVTYRPIDALSISMDPSFTVSRQTLQYVDTVELDQEDRYIFAQINQKTLAITLRLNYSITPDLSIQFYGQPFISSGKYTDFKSITNPRAAQFTDRFRLFESSEMAYDAAEEYYDVTEKAKNGASYQFEDPNFNSLQFQSNLVVRWEYTPGSTLYVVWSQGRTDTINEAGDFSFRNNMKSLFRLPPHNVFLVKFTYRFKI